LRKRLCGTTKEISDIDEEVLYIFYTDIFNAQC
jgi:hypothetical protein